MQKEKLSVIHTAPEFLEAIRLCMNYGYLTTHEIVACTDKMILSSENPDSLILDISIAHNKEAREIDYIINQYVGDTKPPYAARILMSLLHHQFANNELSVKETAARLYRYWGELNLNPEEKNIFYSFDGELDAAEEGIYGYVEEITIRMTTLLSIYQEYMLNNYPDWAMLHERVNLELKKFETDAVAIYHRYPPLPKPSAGLFNRIKRLLSGN